MTQRIAVIGAGPAGTATACGLSSLGYEVMLIHRPRRRYAVEGISDRTLYALRQLHCINAADSVGMQVEREVTWNGETSRKNREYILERHRFDQALLDDARAAGVTLIPGQARGIEPTGSGWRLRIQPLNHREPVTRECDFLVEARGRGTPKGAQDYRTGPQALALSQTWQLPVSGNASRLATFAQGWGWFIAGTDGKAVLQLMTQGKAQALTKPSQTARPHNLGALYSELLSQFDEAQQWLTGATALGDITACGAGMRLNQQPVSGNHIAVGDAALAPDPLSGHGIFESLSSALTAIPVVHTLLQQREKQNLAFAFYQQRLAQRFLQLARVGRDFYQMETRWPDLPFWRARRHWPDQLPAHPAADSAPATMATKPVICEGIIDKAEVVVTADNPLGVLQVSGIPLVPLLNTLKQQSLTPMQAAKQFHAPVADLQQAYAWLRQHRLL